MAYSADIEHLERSLKESHAETEREKQIGNEFAYKIIVLSCEIERMANASGGSGRSGVNSREYQELEQNYSRLESKVVSKNNEIDILMSKISSLEQKYCQCLMQSTGANQRIQPSAERCPEE